MRVRNSVDGMERETVNIVVVGDPEGLPLKAEPIPEFESSSTDPTPHGGSSGLKGRSGSAGPEPTALFPETKPGPSECEPEERLIPAYLTKYFHHKADVLGPGCLTVVYRCLNQRVIGLSERHFQKDWTGLAECLGGYSVHEIDCFKVTSNPTECLLVDWRARSGSTVQRLLEAIHDIGRFDLLEGEALRRTIETSVKNYEERLRITLECENEPQPVQPKPVPAAGELNSLPRPVPTTGELNSLPRPVPTTGRISTGEATVPREVRPPNEMKQIVVDDVGQIFDAFVCYTQADFTFMTEMITELEDERGLKLCICSRDLLAGTAKYVVTAELIEHRCKRIVVVLSENFLNQNKADNPECEFQLRFGQSLSPGAHQNILIPVVIDTCRLPSFLNHVSPLTYSSDLRQRAFFWRRLAASLGAPLVDVEEANHREAFRQVCFNLDHDDTLTRDDLKSAAPSRRTDSVTDSERTDCVSVTVRPSSDCPTAVSSSDCSSDCVPVRILPDSCSSHSSTPSQCQSSPGVVVTTSSPSVNVTSSPSVNVTTSSPKVIVKTSSPSANVTSSPSVIVTTSSAQSPTSRSSTSKKTKNKLVNFFKRKKER